ncbi:hypothetical protein KR222_009911, partial [Zaprionus bogoriensis]
LIVCGLLGVRAQLSLDKIDLQGQLSEEQGLSNFSYEVKDVVRKKCIELSGEEAGDQAFTDILSGFTTLSECMGNIVNYTAMQQEIQKASPRGELDVVFNKYCKKRSDAIECFDVFSAKLTPCLDKEEQESQDVLKRIVQSLLNFVCHKDGDQIALFIAEEGPECLESQRNNIQQCFNSTFSTYFNGTELQDSNKVTTIPKLVVGEKQCGDIHKLESCIVNHLEHCTKITPANLIESMFHFIRNETLCRNYHPLPLTGGAAYSPAFGLIWFAIVISSQLVFMLFKRF